MCRLINTAALKRLVEGEGRRMSKAYRTELEHRLELDVVRTCHTITRGARLKRCDLTCGVPPSPRR